MSLGTNSLGLFDEKSSFSFVNWALEKGVLDGRSVFWERTSDFKEEVEKKIGALLIFQDPLCSDFHLSDANLAWMGASSENRQALIKAVATAISSIAVPSLSLGALSGSALADGLSSLNEKKEPKKTSDPVLKRDQGTDFVMLSSETPISHFGVLPHLLPFVQDGVLHNNQFSAYNDIPQTRLSNEFGGSFPSNIDDEAIFVPDISLVSLPQFPEEKRWYNWILETIGHEVIFGESGEVNIKPSLPHKEPSQVFRTEGIRYRHLQIGGINGIATMLKDAGSHAEYLRKFTPNLSVEWVYNHSNTGLVDIGEVFLVNFPGYSPNTEDLLLKNWTAFHQANIDNPDAKYLQFVFSQGAIHGENALIKAPEEIRQRVIVVAISPAAVITDGICYKAYNYASKKDVVPYAEEFYVRFLGLDGEEGEFQLQEVIKRREHLILLDPHPDVSFLDIDHHFQSPTFSNVIKDHIKAYLKLSGGFQ